MRYRGGNCKFEIGEQDQEIKGSLVRYLAHLNANIISIIDVVSRAKVVSPAMDTKKRTCVQER